jgi:putative oxidoreductase
MMHRVQRYFQVTGRGLLGLAYFVSGLRIIPEWDQTAALLADKGLPAVPHLLGIAAVVLLVGGLSVIVGYRTRWGALSLAAFTVVAMVVFHDFWNMVGGERHDHLMMFLANVGLLGGLLIVAGFGPGSFSIDRSH